MKKLLFTLLSTLPLWAAAQALDLSGRWSYQLDPNEMGITQDWQNKIFTEELYLPGSLTTNNIGRDITVDTKWTGQVDGNWWVADKYKKYREPGNVKVNFWLQPIKEYVGAAWYTKEFTITKEMADKPLQIHLERVHWESTLWVDGKKAGTQNSLGTPHHYIVQPLAAGKHKIAVRVDNRITTINPGHDAHSVTDHTQTNWNGIAGKMSVTVVQPVSVEQINVFPNLAQKSARVVVRLNNQTGAAVKGTVALNANSKYTPRNHKVAPLNKNVELKTGGSEVELIYPMGNDFFTWDEFTPYLYELTASFNGKEMNDTRNTTFGMREVGKQELRFTINGRPIFMRGALDCAVFPKTGHPATNVDEWLRIFSTCKAHGLNHIRFHSWCPPEAAFEAADRLGVYLQPEGGGWAGVGDGDPFDKFINEESDRILATYGNHPSFLFYTYGNEPNGGNQARFLGDLILRLRAEDPRHMYTSAGGWPQIEENDYHNIPWPRIYQYGDNLKCIINAKAPSADYDWTDRITSLKIPTLSHEIGAWCAYPNFREIDKYQGAVRARNYEIFRDFLADNGMEHLGEAFLMASGKLQTLCYKAEIEAALRTKGFAGFQLLGLQDFPGQGSAPVGVLDAFWESKGYSTAEDYHKFSGEVVPIARLKKMIFKNNETFYTPVEIANFGQKKLKGVTPSWTISKADGEIIGQGNLPKTDIAIDNCIPLGEISMPLASLTEATQLKLAITVAGHTNDWDLWVYPSEQPLEAGEVILTQEMTDDIWSKLEKGAKVLFNPKKGSIKEGAGGEVVVGFSSLYWNTTWTKEMEPHIMGVYLNPEHPAMAKFPTEYHSNFQWWDAMNNSNAININILGVKSEPIIRLVDDWVKARNLALVTEAKVGKGKLIISGLDLTTNINNRIESKQLLVSLLAYMNSDAFNPTASVNKKMMANILK